MRAETRFRLGQGGRQLVVYRMERIRPGLLRLLCRSNEIANRSPHPRQSYRLYFCVGHKIRLRERNRTMD